ncbi:hypothetical protein [Xanthomonas tesorieronis]|uniref:hypothetical protein n=1 Tax=Xanthomonas tesorieronis TaxID=3160839 RepID=UPI0035195699
MKLKPRLHAIGAATTAVLLAGFWSATAISELFLSLEAVALVKQVVAFAVFGLALSMATTAITGISMARKGSLPLLQKKRQRMPFIAFNGVAILIPSAIFLSLRATADRFDTWFYIVQGIELVVGAINITLIALNIRDGLRLRERRTAATAHLHPSKRT